MKTYRRDPRPPVSLKQKLRNLHLLQANKWNEVIRCSRRQEAAIFKLDLRSLGDSEGSSAGALVSHCFARLTKWRSASRGVSCWQNKAITLIALWACVCPK